MRPGVDEMDNGDGPVGIDTDTLFRLLVSAVKEYAIFLLSPDGTVVTWNNGAQRLKGYRDHEIVGRHFSTFYPPEDIAAGKPDGELVIAARDGSCTDEGWRVRADGTRFWAHVTITALREDEGELRGFAKVTRDDTQARAAAGRAAALEEITSALLAHRDLVDVLHLVAANARRLVGAVQAWICGPADEPGRLVVQAADGSLPAPRPGDRLPAEGTLAQRVLATGEPVFVDDLRSSTSVPLQLIGTGAGLAVPLVAGDNPIGVLLAAAPAGANPFRPVNLEVLRTFAAQAAVVIEYFRFQQALRQQSVIEDRARIAGDLHTSVIRQLSWTGMSLQAALQYPASPPVRARIETAVERLDATIDQVRNAVFELRAS